MKGGGSFGGRCRWGVKLGGGLGKVGGLVGR